MSIWKRLFGSRGAASSSDVSPEVRKKFGLVHDGRTFAFQGGFVDAMRAQLSTPDVCAAETNKLSAREVCIMLTDPLLIIAKCERGPLAFQTSLSASRAQEFVDALNAVEVRICDSGKIYLATLRPKNA